MLTPFDFEPTTRKESSNQNIGNVKNLKENNKLEQLISNDPKSLNKISNLLDMKILNKLKEVFENSPTPNFLSRDRFIDALQPYADTNEIEYIFKKIDVNNNSRINWQDFTTFLILTVKDTEAITTSNTQVLLLHHIQEYDRKTTHRDMIQCICYCQKPFPIIITADAQGYINKWNAIDLTFINRIIHKDKNVEFIDNMKVNLTTTEKAYIKNNTHSKYQTNSNVIINNNNSTSKNILITCMAVMSNSIHLCVGSVDNSITIYDLVTLDIWGRFINILDIPTYIDIASIETDNRALGGLRIHNQFLCFGDIQGKNIIYYKL
jgi:hypothetical protein